MPAPVAAGAGTMSDDVPPVARIGPARSPARAYLALARPKQWVKNALLLAAPGAAGVLGDEGVPLRLLFPVIAFCMLSAGIYAVNDVRDRHEDRRHPRKCRRPVAAGEISPRDASLFGLVAVIGGLALATAVTPVLGLVALGYLVVTVSYSMYWRRIAYLDLLALAAGFVLRAIGGGVAAPVPLSRWFIVVVTCAAVFVAAGKRMAELVRATATGQQMRRVLESYTERGLKTVLALSGAGAILAYAVWAFELVDIDVAPWRPLTVIPFIACLLRYGKLVRSGNGEAPEEILVSDRGVALGGLVWLILFIMSVHAAG